MNVFRGRTEIPVQEHERRGTYRPHRHDGKTPQPPGVPSLPFELDAEMQNLWDYYITLPQLRAVLTESDGLALYEMCHAHLTTMRLREKLRSEGETYSGGTLRDEPRMRPECKLLGAVEKRWFVWMEHFGLTPATRNKAVRVQAPEDERKDGAWQDLTTMLNEQ